MARRPLRSIIMFVSERVAMPRAVNKEGAESEQMLSAHNAGAPMHRLMLLGANLAFGVRDVLVVAAVDYQPFLCGNLGGYRGRLTLWLRGPTNVSWRGRSDPASPGSHPPAPRPRTCRVWPGFFHHHRPDHGVGSGF